VRRPHVSFNPKGTDLLFGFLILNALEKTIYAGLMRPKRIAELLIADGK